MESERFFVREICWEMYGGDISLGVERNLLQGEGFFVREICWGTYLEEVGEMSLGVGRDVSVKKICWEVRDMLGDVWGRGERHVSGSWERCL